jgi:hypothetical protein
LTDALPLDLFWFLWPFLRLRLVEREYSSLYNKRNELLHATWFVGFPTGDDLDAKDFFVRKFKTSADGLTAAKLPKNSSELSNLSDRCQDVRLWLGQIDFCIQDDLAITDFFKREQPDEPWKFFIGSGPAGMTLPRK